MVDTTLKLVAGLGNPGREYEATRHNVGFMVVEEIARRIDTNDWRRKFGTEYVAAMNRGIILVKPMEYMNDSGPPLNATARFFRVPPTSMLVVSDDLDLPFGKLRMRVSGGHGGHNGLRSIIDVMGQSFLRLRVGIGRSGEHEDARVIDRVLGPFTADERRILDAIIAAAAEGALRWHDKGVDPAMRFVNTWQNGARTDAPT